MIVEIFFSVTWNKLYFRWGLPIYSRTIKVPQDFSWRLPISTMSANVVRRFWPVVTFSGISDERCGFRESYLASFDLFRVPYAPIMRGAIILDASRQEVRIVGLCNWYVPIAIVFVFGPAVLLNAAFIPIVSVLLGGSYALQRARFNHVSATVATTVKNG